jgi:hypothetical protein
MASRVLLFEVSRHSDHHIKADKPYQTLDCEPESPVMPTGYSVTSAGVIQGNEPARKKIFG